MRRREFILAVGGAAAWPLAGRAQQGSVYRLGFLRDGPPPPSFMEGFRRGLRELGYVEGQNITIHYGWRMARKSSPKRQPNWSS